MKSSFLRRANERTGDFCINENFVSIVRTLRWIFTFDNSGRTHGSPSRNKKASRRSASAPSSSRTSGCRIRSSWTRSSPTFTSLPPATSSFVFTIPGASHVAYGEYPNIRWHSKNLPTLSTRCKFFESYGKRKYKRAESSSSAFLR